MFVSTTTQEPYGAMFTVDQIRRANREAGGHYFDDDTMRFFGSRVLDDVYGGRFFVTSERSGFDRSSPRCYSVREFMPDGSIETVGDFCGYATSSSARSAARRLVDRTHDYYFDGQHGEGGRELCYVVTATDPWDALERLHRNFRVRHCGRASDWMTGEHYPRLTTVRAARETAEV